MWGIVPAAGRGTRIQPLAFSKELLPVGSCRKGDGERPCAVSEYLVERMILAGVDKLAFVIGAGKSDIVSYYGAGYEHAMVAYLVQPAPLGLCDAIFRAAPLIGDEPVLVGLPDTIWFPKEGFVELPDDKLSFLLFPVARPELFDAVLLRDDGSIAAIEVKEPGEASRLIWGSFKMPARVFHELHALWKRPERRDEYIGTLVNAYLAEGGEAVGIRAGEAYVDVGTVNGYEAALKLLARSGQADREAERVRLSITEPLGRVSAPVMAQ
ncbi:MAG: nucleotidyltransferase family protein [Hyphomicrobiales bacterium]|nr:nucleotidyltransferase family protein [Hyphomicrobiales bacterium]